MSNLSPDPRNPAHSLPAAVLRADDANLDLETVTAAIDAGEPLAHILDLIVERACILLHADETFVLLREEDWLVCAAQRGLDDTAGGDIRLGIDEGIEGWVATHRRPLVMIDPYRDGRFRDLPQRRHNIAAIVALPLVADSQVLGVLTAASTQPTDFSDNLLLLLVLADLATLAIEEGRRRVRDIRRSRLIDLLRFVSNRDYDADLPAALQPVADRIAEVIGTEKVDLIFLDESHDLLISLGVSNTPLGRKQRELGLDKVPFAADSLLKIVYMTGETALVNDARRDARVYRPFVEQLGLRSLVYSPLAVGGERRGLIACSSTRLNAFDADDRDVIDLIARRLSLALQHLELSEDLNRLEAERLARLERDSLLELLVHDLKNPLSIVKGYTQIAQRRLARGDTAYVASALENMDTRINQVTAMINDMLDMTRMIAGTFSIRRQDLDLVALVRGEVEAAQTTTSRHTFQLAGPDALPVQGDAGRLIEVIQNLLTNAIQYSPEGGTIRITLAAEDGAAEVAVCDEGMGIAPEDLAHVFERAYRGQGEKVARGQGLGLYISREIMRLHGGTIRVASTPGAGSCFTVSLPLAPV